MMAALKKPKHELLARLIAQGKTQTEAGLEVGFNPVRASRTASEICKRKEVKDRIAELRREIVRNVVTTAVISKQWVIDTLVQNIRDAREDKQYAVVKSSVELIGKHLEMFIDRSDHTIHWDGDLSGLSDQQLDRITFQLERLAYGDDRARAEAARRKALLEAGAVVDIEPEPQVEGSKEDGGEW